jgi:F0F1-type ATP synthase membrane subunit c/vacuolar-type H+-ATPase subunit K
VTTRDQEEQDLRIDQMTINIEKMRRDMRAETIKIGIALFAALAAAVGAGIAVSNWARPTAPQPMFPPGTVITIPPAADIEKR